MTYLEWLEEYVHINTRPKEVYTYDHTIFVKGKAIPVQLVIERKHSQKLPIV